MVEYEVEHFVGALLQCIRALSNELGKKVSIAELFQCINMLSSKLDKEESIRVLRDVKSGCGSIATVIMHDVLRMVEHQYNNSIKDIDNDSIKDLVSFRYTLDVES